MKADMETAINMAMSTGKVKMGYKEVYIFFGGWLDWQMAGYPTEADE